MLGVSMRVKVLLLGLCEGTPASQPDPLQEVSGLQLLQPVALASTFRQSDGPR